MEKFLDTVGRLFWAGVLFLVFCLLAAMAGNSLFDLLTRPSLSEVNRSLARLATFRKTPATVDEVKIWRIGEERHPRFAATVTYHFEVDGKTYTGDCLSLYRCFYQTHRFGSVGDAIKRVHRYYPNDGIVSEYIGTDSRLGSAPMKFTAYASNIKTQILYDPSHPETAVLDMDEYEDLFFYGGANPTLQPLRWSDFYGAPLFIFIFFSLISLAMLWAIFRVLQLRIPFTSSPKLLVTYHPETKVFEHRFQSPAHNVILKVLGIFLFFCAYGTWRAGLEKSTSDLVMGTLVGLCLGGFGLLLFSFRRIVEIHVLERTVTHLQSLWLVVHTLKFQKTWKLSDFDRVVFRTQFVQARGSSICFLVIALGFSGKKKVLSLVVQEANAQIVPSLFTDYAQEISKVTELPLVSE